MATTTRTSLDNLDSNVHIEKANQFSKTLDTIPLNILDAQRVFQDKVNDFNEHDTSSTKLPADIATDFAAQLTFVRKLKFHYLEQNAKDKYVKIIVSDDPPSITVDGNAAIRQSNETKKAKLKLAKDELAARHERIKQLAPEVERDYKKAKDLTTEASALAQQILDARLTLSRIRTAHPHPRLTIASANATLDDQTEAMATLDMQLSDVNARVDQVKAAVQEGAREVERLRVERAEKEKEVREHKAEEEDGRVIGLYDWYTASLTLHRSLFSLHKSHSVSENELALTYHITPTSTPRRHNAKPIPVTLTLLFHPNTRQLADAHLTGPHPVAEIDIQDVVGSHAQANDVPGLVRALLAGLRATL